MVERVPERSWLYSTSRRFRVLIEARSPRQVDDAEAWSP